MGDSYVVFNEHWALKQRRGSGSAIYLVLCAGAWFPHLQNEKAPVTLLKINTIPYWHVEKCVWQCIWGTGKGYIFDGCLIGICGNSAMESRQDLCTVPEAPFTMCSLRVLKGSSSMEPIATGTFQEERSLSQQKCLLPLKNIIPWGWGCK